MTEFACGVALGLLMMAVFIVLVAAWQIEEEAQ